MNWDHLEDWRDFKGYSHVDGCVWQFKPLPKVQEVAPFSHFIADKEGDAWYICFMTFQKFMFCNDRSPIKLDEINLDNGSFNEYPCFDESFAILDNCGADLLEPMFETYRVRVRIGNKKPPSYTRTRLMNDKFNDYKDGKVLHF